MIGIRHITQVRLPCFHKNPSALKIYCGSFRIYQHRTRWISSSSSAMSKSQPRINLILDFDGTITTEDSTAIIGSKCIADARELAQPNLPEDQLPKSMQYYSDKYMQEYQQWKQSLTDAPETKSLDDEVSRLSQSRHVEQHSFMRVRNAVLNVPGGMSKLQQNEAARNEFMTDAGREAIRSGELQIRDLESLQRLFSKTDRYGNGWGIVSVSWSRRFILGVLLESGLINRRIDSPADRIKCNELLAPQHVDEDGNVHITCSAQDKLKALQQLLQECSFSSSKDASSPSGGAQALTIYVGDSSTDLGCLAGVDVGMYVGQKDPQHDSVLRTLDRLRVKTLRSNDLPVSNVLSELTNMKTELQKEGRPPHIICSISGFDEIDEWLSKILSDKG